MGLFDQIVGAIANPNQEANPDQLRTILSTVNQLSNQQGIDPGMTQTAISVVGSYLRSSLQQQRATGGTERAEAMVNQFSGTQASAGALQALLTPDQQRQVAQAVSQRTGLDPSIVMTLLPTLVPLALNLLRGGATSSQAASNPGANSVLSTFLDADGDGDVDLGDTLSMAGRYLQR